VFTKTHETFVAVNFDRLRATKFISANDLEKGDGFGQRPVFVLILASDCDFQNLHVNFDFGAPFSSPSIFRFPRAKSFSAFCLFVCHLQPFLSLAFSCYFLLWKGSQGFFSNGDFFYSFDLDYDLVTTWAQGSCRRRSTAKQRGMCRQCSDSSPFLTGPRFLALLFFILFTFFA